MHSILRSIELQSRRSDSQWRQNFTFLTLISSLCVIRIVYFLVQMESAVCLSLSVVVTRLSQNFVPFFFLPPLLDSFLSVRKMENVPLCSDYPKAAQLVGDPAWNMEDLKVHTICWGKYTNLLLYYPLQTFFKHALAFTEQNTHVEGEINRRCCNSAVFVAKGNNRAQ